MLLGSGNFYVGTVPAAFKTVTDFSVTDAADARLELVPEASPLSKGNAPATFSSAAASSFLAVDTSPSTTSNPLFTANPSSRLGPGATMGFAALEGLLYVHEPATGSTVAAAKFYLETVAGSGGKTRMLKWCADQIACERAGDTWVALVRGDRATKAVM